MRYDGGKGGAGVFQKIINLMPPHDVYIEAFVGGGNIFERKRPALASIVIDADAAVTDIWRARDIAACTVICGDAIEFLRSYQWKGGELVYCDPPYVLSSRRGGAMYRHEMTDDQHRELLAVLAVLPVPVILSGYRNAIYSDAVPDWNTIDFQAMTRRGVATETVWFNFPVPSVLHDLRYVGDNFRARERLKRKKSRWVARLAKMDPLERAVLLDALQAFNLAPSP